MGASTKRKKNETLDVNGVSFTADEVEALCENLLVQADELTNAHHGRRVVDKRIQNQRRQIRELDEKLAAMKTWRGIFRTAGQRLGICR